MAGPPKVTQAALAKACKVRQPSVSDWLSGRTRSMDSENLIAAARFLNVRPEWLATGKGEMRLSEEAVKNSCSEMGFPSQTTRLDANTLGRAMKFTKLYLQVRGEKPDLESHPHVVLAAYSVVSEVEGAMDEVGFIAAMGRLARRLGVDDGDDRQSVV
jgi:transcriptional regulator with XRE-family HTH domain